MTRNYQVTSVEQRDRISHADFYEPRTCVTLIREEDGEVFRILFPVRRSPKRGDHIRLDDEDVRAIRIDPAAKCRQGR